jgi:hypothetical protein
VGGGAFRDVIPSLRVSKFVQGMLTGAGKLCTVDLIKVAVFFKKR